MNKYVVYKCVTWTLLRDGIVKSCFSLLSIAIINNVIYFSFFTGYLQVKALTIISVCLRLEQDIFLKNIDKEDMIVCGK